MANFVLNRTGQQVSDILDGAYSANGILKSNGLGTITAQTVDSSPTALSTNLVTSGGVASALSGKQNTLANASLLATYTQTEANLASAVSLKHSHSNKSVLDGISSSDVSAWNAKQDALTNTDAQIQTAVSDAHTHSNKAILDTIPSSGTTGYVLKKTESGTAWDESVTVAQLLALLPTDTVSGAVASFPDGADDVPMESLSVALEPIQDLHGYSNPWIGDNGRNKFNPTEAQNNKWVNNTTGAIENATGYWVTGFIPVKAGDVVRCPTKGSARNAWYNADKSQATYVSYSGGSNGITAPADGFIVLTVKESDFPFGSDSNFVVTRNDADLTYAPYSNICPISGFTGCNLYRAPVVYPFTQGGLGDANGTETISSTRIRTDFIPYNNELTIKLIGIGCESDDRTRRIYWYDSSKTFISSNTLDGGSQELPYTYTGFTAPTGSAYYRICLQKLVSSENISASGKMLSINPNVYAITWQTEAGTVYGGTLDVTNGVLTVTHQLWQQNTADMDNAENYPGWKNSGIKALIGEVNQAFDNQIMNIGSSFSANTTGARDILFLSASMYYKTQTEWIALAQNVQIAVKLATPITYQLSPTEITTLLGDNTVWSDSGDVSVTYKANIQKYIDKKIAEL